MRHCPDLWHRAILKINKYSSFRSHSSSTIIDLENCQSNPKFETVVDSFVVKSEAEIEKYIALCKQAEAFQKDE